MKRQIAHSFCLVALMLLAVPALAAPAQGKAAAAATAQQAPVTVKGRVLDASGMGLVGATVVVKGTSNVTITDDNGGYTLNGVPSTATLEITYIGFATQDVPVQGRSVVDVTMVEDTNLLEELVVVGYGVQKKVNLSGSVAHLNVEEAMKTRTINNLSNALAGTMAGVSALQSSGAPGSDGATIRVRGLGTLNDSSPLVIIDGMQGTMDAVNPIDVANISILKDAASCAIYGAQAANGVILITTKTGKKGKLNVTYNGRVTFDTPASKYGFISDYVEYMELRNEGAVGYGLSQVYADTTIEEWRQANKNPNGLTELGYPNYVAYPNTNWEDELFRTSTSTEHTVSLNGGAENVRYLLSAGYLHNKGIVKQTGIQRYSFRTNLEADVTPWLTVGTRTYAHQQDHDRSGFGNAQTYIIAVNPGTYPKWDGVYGGSAANEENVQDNNLSFYLDSPAGSQRVSRINTTMYTKVKFTKDLSYDFNFNYSRRFDETNSYSHGSQYKMNFRTGNITQSPTSLVNMSLGNYRYDNWSRTIENLLRYHHTWGKHDFNAMVGYNEYYYKEQSLNTSKQGFIDYTITVPSAVAEMKSITGGASDTATRSVFGRLGYVFNDRYIFEANVRYDGSSRFAQESRWGWFPSFSAAWRLSEEPWMANTRSWLDNLKLRASYGTLGNSRISEYLYQSTYGNVYYTLNNQQNDGLASTSMANAALEWESTTVANLGVDASLLNNRLTVEAEVYNKLTDGILYRPTIYYTAGNKTAPYQNIAEVTNRGIELTVGWKGGKGKDFNYGITGNISFNKNWVSKYKGKLERGWVENADGTREYKTNLGDVSTGGATRVLEDHMINEYYLLDLYKGDGNYYNSDGTPNVNGGPTDGMIRTEQDMQWVKDMIAAGYTFMPNQGVAKGKIWYGDYLYADRNGDGIYGNSADNDFQGYSNRPPIFYGFNLNARYKNLDITANFAGTAHARLYWNGGVGFTTAMRSGYAIPKHIAHDHYFYDPENPSDPRTNINAKYGRLVGVESGFQSNSASTLYLYKANYLKLKNLSIGYTLPNTVSRKVSVEGVRLFFNGENLFTLTKYPGMDPELGATYTYMIARTFSLGANITF